MGDGPIDPARRRRAERRILTALRRHLRREPLRPDIRLDALVAEVRAAEPSGASRHRGRQPLGLSDADLRAVVDAMVASGTLGRSGHRVRLTAPGPRLDATMQERLDQLLAILLDAGLAPPPAERLAARLGIPPALVDQLRAAGDLVQVGPRIDYPRAAWAEISERLDRLAADAPLSGGRVKQALQTTRRHADAILRRRNTVSGPA